MRAFGANLVEHGKDFQSAREEADRRAEAGGFELVPSFHPDLVLGRRDLCAGTSAGNA